MAEKMTKKENVLQVLKFAFFSASAGIIETVVFTLMNETFTLPYWPSYLTALVMSVLWNFTFNRKFTFQSAVNIPIAMLKVAAFYAVFTPVSTIIGNHFAEAGVNEYIVLACTMACNLTTEYIYDRFVVFTDAGATKKKENEEQESVEEKAE